MPLSLVEAMAAGCAVIGSDVPGIHELLHDGEDGRLVTAADPAALAAAIEALLREPEQAERLAQRGQAAALAHHSLALMTSRYDDLFDALVRGD
jgi:glycosyltransferase involved in cell wall biosynthesis